MALVSSQDAHTIKHLVENAVWQLINQEAAVCIVFKTFSFYNPKIKQCFLLKLTYKGYYQYEISDWDTEIL